MLASSSIGVIVLFAVLLGLLILGVVGLIVLNLVWNAKYPLDVDEDIQDVLR